MQCSVDSHERAGWVVPTSTALAPALSRLTYGLLLVAATLPQVADAQNVAIPSFYDEPGYSSTRDFADASGTETIDPYTGQLHLHYRDLVVPGNGGLDIVVNRTYHSPTKQNSPYEYLNGQTATGLGWDINFGRIWPGPNIAFFSNTSNPNRTSCRLSGTNVSNNPVLELPDGSRQVLVSTSSGVSTHAYVTANQWIAKCLMSSDYSGGAGDGQAPDGGLLVVSPEGVRYFFDRYRRVADGPSMQAYHPTRIVHPNGTELTFTYRAGNSGQLGGGVAQGDFAMINTISSSDSRTVTFNYVDKPGTSGWVKPRLTSIVLNGSPSRTWTYNYALLPIIAGQPAVEVLDDVVRPGGTRIDLEYYTASVPEKNALRWIDMPGGGRVRYEYDTKVFANRDATSQTLIVVSRKINEGSINPGGTWDYNYIPAGSSGTEDVTTVTDPEGCTEYRHRTARSGDMWEEGTLRSTRRYAGACSGTALRTETYTWDNMPISTAQGRWRRPGFSEGAPYRVPILSLKSTIQDGSTYSIDYSDFDTFGYPQQVDESSPQGSRTTDLDYFPDPSNLWIKGRVQTQTVRSAGIVGGSPVDAVTSRSFSSSNGNLTSETRYGVTTNYQYHSSGISRGEISRITDANGNVTILEDYKRGIPQSATRKVTSTDPDTSPNNIVVSRVANNTGTLASETNGRQKTTAYGYDSLDLLTSVTTPKLSDSDISIDHSFSGSGITRTLTRGNFREIRTFDGLGRLSRIESRDLAAGGATVNQFFDYDALGRRTKSYNPTYGATRPGQYLESSYDDLDRVTTVYNPFPIGLSTRTSVGYDYQGSNTVVRTDERGWRITSKYRSFGDPAARELIEISGPTMTGQPLPSAYRETKIERTKLGTMTRIEQGVTGNLLARTFVHDNRFLPDQEIHPEAGTTDLGTDAVGNITSRTVASAATVTYQYDGLNRLDLVDYSGASATPSADVDYVYDRNSNLDTVVKAGTQWGYLYDDNDNLEYETLSVAGASYQVRYQYNALDALERITYPDGLQVDYAPDNLSRPTRVGNYVTSISYHPNGQVQSISYANGHIETVGQNERLLPTAFQVGRAGFARIVDKLYGYDGAGNIDTLTDYANSSNDKSMGYNGWNEITAANGPWGSGSFSYDVRSNLRTRNLGVLGNLTLNYSATTNRLDNVNGSQYSYDVFGNVTSRQTGGRVFNYDDSSDLTRAQTFGTLPQVDYTYDGHGRRSREVIAAVVDRRALYSSRGVKLYERETVNGEDIDYVYLGSRLITSRSHCYSMSDGDADGIPNCVEARAGMSPTSAGDAAVDSDSDGLTNLQEYQAGTGFTNSDTDRDAISDSYEVRYGLGALTSNASADTDGDGLTNLQEFQLGTNPTDTDTDNDGIPDAQDPKPKFNPAILVPILQIILGD